MSWYISSNSVDSNFIHRGVDNFNIVSSPCAVLSIAWHAFNFCEGFMAATSRHRLKLCDHRDGFLDGGKQENLPIVFRNSYLELDECYNWPMCSILSSITMKRPSLQSLSMPQTDRASDQYSSPVPLNFQGPLISSASFLPL